MNAQVISVFRHEFNALEVAKQEYEFAKQHFKHICGRMDSTSPEGRQRFHDALDRQTAAREKYLRLLCD